MSISVTENPLINNNNNNNNNETNEYFGDGEFEFASEWSQPYLKSAHKAVTRCKLWNWLQNYEPEEGKGFMFTIGVPELDRLSKELMKDPVNGGHSGSSYACIMRNMEFIAKHGYQEFKAGFNK
jgi:hypothetical protein